MSKKERLQLDRKREKLEKDLGSISEMNRLPGAIFIVDIVKEKIAVLEARKLGIPTFAMVDTNTNPSLVDFPIPANDDASKSITAIINIITSRVKEGLEERKKEKEIQTSVNKDEAPEELKTKKVEETEKAK